MLSYDLTAFFLLPLLGWSQTCSITRASSGPLPPPPPASHSLNCENTRDHTQPSLPVPPLSCELMSHPKSSSDPEILTHQGFLVCGGHRCKNHTPKARKEDLVESGQRARPESAWICGIALPSQSQKQERPLGESF